MPTVGGEHLLFGGIVVLVVVKTVCWILRERSRRRTLVDLERERRITLIALAELEPDRAEHLRARLDRVPQPPPDQIEPPAAS